MKALVIGATGATGRELIKALITDQSYTEVVAFVRKPFDFENSKVTAMLVDFNNPEAWKHLINGDVAFSCIGTTLKDAGSKEKQWKIDYDYQFDFAKYAKENSVKQFVLVSATGASAKSNFFYQQMKGKLEDSIKQLNFQNLVILKPGMLDRPNTNRLGEKILLKILKRFNSIGVLRSQKALPTSKLAKAMVNISKIEKDHFLEISGKHIFDYAENVIATTSSDS